jgi:hypothetical protein
MSDGRLVFGYGPSAVADAKNYDGRGYCLTPKQPELAVMPGLSAASIRSATLAKAPPGCGYVRAVPDAWGVLAVEGCGANDLGATMLVQLNGELKISGHWRLPSRQDGTSLSVSPGGHLALIDEYEAPGYSGSSTVRQATDWVEVFNGSRLHVLRRTLDARASISSAVW